jgi:ribosomal protein S6
VNEYEILLLLDVDLDDERQAEIVTRVRELVEKGGGSWDLHDVWGRRSSLRDSPATPTTC